MSAEGAVVCEVGVCKTNLFIIEMKQEKTESNCEIIQDTFRFVLFF